MAARAARVTVRTLAALRGRKEPISMITAYDYPSALHADRAGIDVVLVGDSVGMVVLGHATTQPVTVPDMLHHCIAARRGVHRAMLVGDMPFGSYEVDAGQAIRTALRFVKEAGVCAVKMEGGVKRAPAIRGAVEAGVAVMGHVGLTPQRVGVLGGFRAAGRTEGDACQVLDDAFAVQDAGAFAVVVECVPERLGEKITNALDIPTIGIGAGAGCNGQVLVYHDMLGIMTHPHHANVAPKFSKQYAQLGPAIHDAMSAYKDEVKSGAFPSPEYAPYAIPDDQFDGFLDYLNQAVSERSDRRRTNSRSKPSTNSKQTTIRPSGSDNDHGNITIY